jgi:hypothetical protein
MMNSEPGRPHLTGLGPGQPRSTGSGHPRAVPDCHAPRASVRFLRSSACAARARAGQQGVPPRPRRRACLHHATRTARPVVCVGRAPPPGSATRPTNEPSPPIHPTPGLATRLCMEEGRWSRLLLGAVAPLEGRSNLRKASNVLQWASWGR